jgi:hypothetical protein
MADMDVMSYLKDTMKRTGADEVSKGGLTLTNTQRMTPEMHSMMGSATNKPEDHPVKGTNN